jgi:hypothetical protein
MSNYQSLSQGYLSPCGYFKIVEYPVVQYMCEQKPPQQPVIETFVTKQQINKPGLHLISNKNVKRNQ